jgi:hypothetical protein
MKRRIYDQMMNLGTEGSNSAALMLPAADY